jgi:hypothetical protein
VSLVGGAMFRYEKTPYWNRIAPSGSGCGTNPVKRSEL